MPNSWFQFKQFRIEQARSAFKVGTDGSLLGAWTPVENAQNILDIGTGTGLVALMMAQRNAKAKITALEPDKESCSEATDNFNQSPWSERMDCLNITLQEYATTTPNKYDLIVSNPPFFSGSLTGPNARVNNARHETTLPLSTLLECATKLSSPAGRLTLILPIARRADLLEQSTRYRWHESHYLLIRPTTEKDHNRFITVLERKAVEPSEEELVLYTSQHQYTEAATSLLSPFYLRL